MVEKHNSVNEPKTPMRRNIREFVARCAERLPLEDPIVDVACGYRNNYPEITLGRVVTPPHLRSI